MCLAVPGKVIEIRSPDAQELGDIGVVDFQGSALEVSLVFTPEARTGDWVLVHAGFALQVLDEEEAMRTWSYLAPEEVDELRLGEGSTRN
jgi:hydrogenase expression/formation protein HypC